MPYQLFPNNEIGQRLFEVVNENAKEQINFVQFARFIILMLEGSQEQKIQFIFKLIAPKDGDTFDKNDLIAFFKLCNGSSSEHLFNVSEADIDDQNSPERDMAMITFDLMGKPYSSPVSRLEFVEFIQQNENNIELFNFLSADARTGRRNVKAQKDLHSLLKNLESLENDVELLANTLFPHKNTISFNVIARISKNFGRIINKKIVND